MDAGWRGRAAGRAALLIAVGAAAAFISLGGWRALDVARLAAGSAALRRAAEAWGAYGLLAFVVADAAALAALVVPSWFCTLVAGVLFGTWTGAACALAGTTAGATAVFAMARAGFGGVASCGGSQPARWAGGLRTHALSSVVALRLVPVVPFTLVNIAAGLARLPLGRFVAGTLIGIVPSVLIDARLGDELIELAGAGRLPGAGVMLRPGVLLPLVALALLALLPALAGRLRRVRGRLGG